MISRTFAVTFALRRSNFFLFRPSSCYFFSMLFLRSFVVLFFVCRNLTRPQTDTSLNTYFLVSIFPHCKIILHKSYIMIIFITIKLLFLLRFTLALKNFLKSKIGKFTLTYDLLPTRIFSLLPIRRNRRLHRRYIHVRL